MDEAAFEKHLNKISDYTEIDDRIVTYKWLSRTLQVHTNTAKQLLNAFSQKVATTGKYLTTYVVAGKPKDEEDLVITVVVDKRLEEIKGKLETISFVHVYSVQKGAAVCGADIFNAEVRGEKQLTASKNTYSGSSIRPSKAITKQDVSTSSAVPPAKVTAPLQTSKVPVAKSAEPPKSKEVPPSKKNGETPKACSPKIVPPTKNDKKPTKGGGIGALLMKQSSKKKEPVAKKAAETKENIVGKTTLPPENVEPKTPTNDSKSKSQSKKKRKKSKDSKDSEPKRKRIQVAANSDSSSEASDADERFPSPEPEVEAPAVIDDSTDEEVVPATPVEKGRRRIRKTIDRVFEDEDGYIKTVKETVVGSCSEDEPAQSPKKSTVEAELPKKAKPNSPAKESVRKTVAESPPSKKTKGSSKAAPSKSKNNSPKSKQSSIMSFFKSK